MKIAYISYEHPLGISGGGIGTYIGQVAKMMSNRGHFVEVFSGTINSSVSILTTNGYTVNLIPAQNVKEFREKVLTIFTIRHTLISFDIIESPEYGADALEIKKTYPLIPLVVKLHTPSFLISELNGYKRNVKDKFRYIAGGLVRGQLSKPYWIYNQNNDPEFELFDMADSVSSPSTSLKRIIDKKWGGLRTTVLAYPFEPSGNLLKIPIKTNQSAAKIVTFIGKLERRKGILDLMKAIPSVLKRFPETRFRFIGKSMLSPETGLNMREYMETNLAKHEKSLEFLGLQEYQNIPSLLNESDICIFPSVYENFPNVCLEAMAAGKAVIGTNTGGMADMITHDKEGFLIPSNSPASISGALLMLLTQPEKIVRFGIAARNKIITSYNSAKIGRLTEELYLKTIAKYG